MKDKRLKVLAEVIRAGRARKKISQEKLAEMIDVGTSTICSIENEAQNPSAFIVYDIARILDIDLSELAERISKV